MSSERVVRNSSVVFALLTLILMGVVAVQSGQLREARVIDCAASQEWTARLAFYDRMITAHSKDSSISESIRAEIVEAYADQRTEVARIARISRQACP